MKFIKILIIPFVIALIFSCGRDEDLGPIITVDNAEIGAFPRLVSLFTGEYDLANISTSAYSHEVEFQSIDAGANIDSYVISVGFNGGSPQVFKTFTQSDFSDSALGLRGITVSFPFTEVAAFLGLDAANVAAGDQFEFTSVVNLSDGRSFNGSASSTESTLLSSAFRGYFDWVVKATCPIEDTAFAGDYVIGFESAGNGYGPAYADGETVTITPVAGSSTLREFSSGLLPAIGPFTGTTRFDIVCDFAVLIEGNTGVGCGGTIVFGPVEGTTEPLSLTDDSQIVLFVDEGASPGNCGGQAGNTSSRLVLTKL